MQGDWLSRRVTLLEQRVERLERLPADVAALRQDVHSEFAGLRADLDVRFDAVHQVLISLQTQVTDNQRTLEAKIDDNRRYALVLHEDVMSTLATLREGYRSRSRPRRK